MEELDKKIQEVMKSKIQEPVDYEQKILNTIRNTANKRKEKRRMYCMKKRIIATACASLVLVSGVVLATNIENIKNHFRKEENTRGLGNGLDTAIENEYIAEPEMDFIKVENVGVNVKIEDFVMDDLNLSTKFVLDFDESLTDTIDLEKINTIEFSDLIVRDEENRIIYSSHNQQAFEKYCNENNLNYKFGEFNENYMNNGLNTFIENASDRFAKVMYNMYSADSFPKSKKLDFSFETITLTECTNGKETKYELNGSWNAIVDVPEKMYNRTEEYYKVVSCDNEDFDVYASKVTDTGFEIGVIISNIEQPEFDREKAEEFHILSDKYNHKEISQEEYLEKGSWQFEHNYLMRPITVTNHEYYGTSKESKASYVENENGKKYESTLSPSRRAKTYFIEGNRYDFYDTFGMTKYDASNKVKVVLYYYGEPVTIELEKIVK